MKTILLSIALVCMTWVATPATADCAGVSTTLVDNLDCSDTNGDGTDDRVDFEYEDGTVCATGIVWAGGFKYVNVGGGDCAGAATDVLDAVVYVFCWDADCSLILAGGGAATGDPLPRVAILTGAAYGADAGILSVCAAATPVTAGYECVSFDHP